MKKILLASVLGGLTLFVWGFLSWALLPFHTSTMRPLSNEDAVISALKAGNATTGLYTIPGIPQSSNGHDGYVAKQNAGPLAYIYYSSDGMNGNYAMYFIRGLLVYFIVVWVAVMLLTKISWSLASYGNRVKFMVMIGLILAVGGRLVDWSFMHYPTDMTLLLALDDIIGWTLVGFVVAKFTKPVMRRE